jgi:hypothetical protein
MHKTKGLGGRGGSSGDDRQLSPLTRILGISCLIWKPPRLLIPTSKTFDHVWLEVLEAVTLYLYLMRLPIISRQVSFVEFSSILLEGQSRSGKLATR